SVCRAARASGAGRQEPAAAARRWEWGHCAAATSDAGDDPRVWAGATRGERRGRDPAATARGLLPGPRGGRGGGAKGAGPGRLARPPGRRAPESAPGAQMAPGDRGRAAHAPPGTEPTLVLVRSRAFERGARLAGPRARGEGDAPAGDGAAGA